MKRTKIRNLQIAFCAALLFVAPLFVATAAIAHDYVPGAVQKSPMLLKGGDLYTVSGDILRKTDLLFENGRITQIGRNIAAPSGSEKIDVSGKRVYPGLILVHSTLGLTEVGAVRATRDMSEVGDITPEVSAHIAYNPDSEIIPTIRSNGITTAQVAPNGNIISGRSCLINLDGWTKEDASEKMYSAMHVNWPSSSVITAWWMDKTAEEQKKENAKKLKRLHDVFEDARAYYMARQANREIKEDLRWEAMLPVFSKEMPVFVEANDYRQIKQAIKFAEDFDLKMVITGGDEAWKLASSLKKAKISVALGFVQATPRYEDDDYDLAYRLPKLLSDAGVKFCLTGGGRSWYTRNLPFQAGQAVAFGLSKAEALRSVTLSAAEILGVEADLGSLEVGKKATLVVSDGDILDQLTNKVVYEFIEGRKVDLNNRHKELYAKYKEKNIQ